jgi:hypothetical protein
MVRHPNYALEKNAVSQKNIKTFCLLQIVTYGTKQKIPKIQ